MTTPNVNQSWNTTGWESLDLDGDGTNESWLDISGNQLLIGNTKDVSGNKTIDVKALLDSKDTAAAGNYSNYKIYVNDDDNTNGTAKININTDVDTVVIDNDFNATGASGLNGWAKASVQVSGQTDALIMEVDMDSNVTKVGDGGTQLDIDASGTTITFSGTGQKTQINTPGMVNANNINVHNFVNVTANGTGALNGTVTQSNCFTIGEFFTTPEAMWTNVGITAASIKGAKTMSSATTTTANAFTGADVSGNAVARLTDATGNVTGYIVRTATKTYQCDANGVIDTTKTIDTPNECPPPPRTCDPDNTFKVTAGTGAAIDLRSLTVDQKNTGLMSGVGDLVGTTATGGFLIQNNVLIDGSGNVDTSGTIVKQNIDVDLVFGTLKATGGNKAVNKGTAIAVTTDNVKAHFSSVFNAGSVTFGAWDGSANTTVAAEALDGFASIYTTPGVTPPPVNPVDTSGTIFQSVWQMIADNWANDSATQTHDYTQAEFQTYLNQLSQMAGSNVTAADAAKAPALYAQLAGADGKLSLTEFRLLTTFTPAAT